MYMNGYIHAREEEVDRRRQSKGQPAHVCHVHLLGVCRYVCVFVCIRVWIRVRVRVRARVCIGGEMERGMC